MSGVWKSSRIAKRHNGAMRGDGAGQQQRPDELALIDAWEADRMLVARHDRLVPVDQPLALISQIQRSGGTLLNSLLDGHPELLVSPYELLIGQPTKYDWPRLDPEGSPEEWLDELDQAWLRPVFGSGYRKGDGRVAPVPADPLLLPPSFLARLFTVLCAEAPPASSRDVLDRYFAAFFNAWLDLQGLWDAPKRWIVGFAPRLAWRPAREDLRRDYSDGRLLCVVRDPRGWYASARGHTAAWAARGTLDEMVALWSRGATEIIAAADELGDDVLVIRYESLVTHPESTMRIVAGWLGIEWHPGLVRPTFNRHPVTANSSFDNRRVEVQPESAERWRSVLDDDVQRQITDDAYDLYVAVAGRASA
jgi:hypothetical protein